MTIRNDESLFIDFIYQDGTIPDGYSCVYSLGNLNGNLERDDDTFKLRVTSSQMKQLQKGEYVLEVALLNDSIGYKEYIYIQELLIQG